jgi:hypothetical protein
MKDKIEANAELGIFLKTSHYPTRLSCTLMLKILNFPNLMLKNRCVISRIGIPSNESAV